MDEVINYLYMLCTDEYYNLCGAVTAALDAYNILYEYSLINKSISDVITFYSCIKDLLKDEVDPVDIILEYIYQELYLEEVPEVEQFLMLFLDYDLYKYTTYQDITNLYTDELKELFNILDLYLFRNIYFKINFQEQLNWLNNMYNLIDDIDDLQQLRPFYWNKGGVLC